MPDPDTLDTTNLLSIMGVVVAVWAIIPQASRLRFRFCMTRLDWGIGGGIFFLANYLTFSPVLEHAGLYYSFGPWLWGFNSASAVYLLFLTAIIYFCLRLRFPVLSKNKIGVFYELVENLLLSNHYDELILLVEPQLPKLIRLSESSPWVAEQSERIRLRIRKNKVVHTDSDPSWFDWRSKLDAKLLKLGEWSQKRYKVNEAARSILSDIVATPDMVTYIAVARPYFCLKLLKADVVRRSEFIEQFVIALLNSPGTRLYVELKNNLNNEIGHRLQLPESNRLLYSFFSDASVAVKLEIYRAIGDTVCQRLDEDKKLAELLNAPLGYYEEIGRFRCPINSGISLFEIMVHEGLHQGFQWHMWLHYFAHFARKIIKKMHESSNEEEFVEFPTPFHYLLYRLIDVSTGWVEQCEYVDGRDIPPKTSSEDEFDKFYISKQAAIVVGAILKEIIEADKFSSKFKTEILENVMRSYRNVKNNAKIDPSVKERFEKCIVYGGENFAKKTYCINLYNVFSQIDPHLRSELEEFNANLKTVAEVEAAA